MGPNLTYENKQSNISMKFVNIHKTFFKLLKALIINYYKFGDFRY
jgi:hypothetical protein